jgi:hypothetical protein
VREEAGVRRLPARSYPSRAENHACVLSGFFFFRIPHFFLHRGPDTGRSEPDAVKTSFFLFNLFKSGSNFLKGLA